MGALIFPMTIIYFFFVVLIILFTCLVTALFALTSESVFAFVGIKILGCSWKLFKTRSTLFLRYVLRYNIFHERTYLSFIGLGYCKYRQPPQFLLLLYHKSASQAN